jgi:hypothetical protein
MTAAELALAKAAAHERAAASIREEWHVADTLEFQLPRPMLRMFDHHKSLAGQFRHQATIEAQG